MKCLLVSLLVLSTGIAAAQPATYTTSNAHSHNDYSQKVPFVTAYKQQFGSIEADVFYVAGQVSLLVGHTEQEIKRRPRTLDSLYLEPIIAAIQRNNGHVYADSTRTLQLMIDLKTDAGPTLEALVRTLQRYPVLQQRKDFRILISGNKPDPTEFKSYPSFILFDANLGENYPAEAMEKIGMISAAFDEYSKWKGKGDMPENDIARLKADIDKAHHAGKRVRLWALPDVPAAWAQMKKLGVDFINTDRIDQLAAFLNSSN